MSSQPRQENRDRRGGGSASPPGWYASRHGGERYWNGTEWTDRWRDSRPPPGRGSDGLVAVGILLALFFPLLGLIVGIILLARNRVGAGVAVLAISITMI